MLAIFLLAACLSVQVFGQLNFSVYSAPNINYFIRDNTTAATVLVTAANASLPVQRLVVAMPQGNSGALSYFLPYDNSTNLTMELVEGSLQTTTAEYNQTGVTGQLSLSNNATLGVTIIGAVRAMRDYVEGSGLTHEIFNFTVANSNSSTLELYYPYINGTMGARFTLSAVDNVFFNATIPANTTIQPTVNFFLSDTTSKGTLSFTITTNDTVIAGLDYGDGFLSASQVNSSLASSANGLADGSNQNAVQFSFLTYTSKFLAGSWRFLTYFGRDQMIAVNLLLPLLQGSAIEASLGSVIARTNDTGALCHEETLSVYASFINIQNNMSYLGDTPFFDYKMIDTDILLLPTLAKYFLELPSGSGRAPAFLNQTSSIKLNGTFAELLDVNIEYNLARAAPFAQNPSVENLLHLREGQPVGNWRDSNEGLGYGRIPFDCNTALMPATLRAIASLSEAGIINSSYATNASAMAEVWETQALQFFRVNITEEQSSSRLNNFIQQANLSTSLLPSGNSSTNASYFYALSLDDDGSPVEVLNSDLGFTLYFASNVSSDVIEATINALQPYPVGLLTNIGMLVANPAYDSNTTNIEVLNRAAYHGTVVWSWQQALMIEGINRQLGLCDSNSTAPAWCSTMRSDLSDARERLFASVNGASSERFSEVWSYTYSNSTGNFTVTDLGSLAPTGTESDAIQLWSYAFLALQSENSTAGAS